MTAADAQKVDLKKQLAHLYNASAKEVTLVDVPPMQFLMIDGAGDPNTAQEYRDAVEALFGVSYALKFMIKKEQQAFDYGVMPLEGLWWTPDMRDFSVANKAAWLWTLLIMQPDQVTAALFEQALQQTERKKPSPALTKLRLATFHEGRAAQIMHIGPYSAEAPTIARLHDFIADQGYILDGKHHEIYLGDVRRAAPEKLKTIIRQPVASPSHA